MLKFCKCLLLAVSRCRSSLEIESFSYKLKVVSVLDFLSFKLTGFGDSIGKDFTVGVLIQSHCKCFASYFSGTAKSFLHKDGTSGISMPD